METAHFKSLSVSIIIFLFLQNMSMGVLSPFKRVTHHHLDSIDKQSNHDDNGHTPEARTTCRDDAVVTSNIGEIE